MGDIKVGFIGLGNIGMLMAKKLMEKNWFITVFDLRKEATEEMVALGSQAAGSSREVAAVSDVVIIVVRDIPQTDEVIFGKDGVWEGIKEGGIIIISSTISPSYCQKLYARAKEKGVRVIDAPVSTEARSFTPSQEWALFTMMIGGDDDTVKRCRPIFETISKNIFYLGGIGMGQACKLVNNLALYGNGIVARESVNLGLKVGLDIQKMVSAMSVSTGYSRALGAVGGMGGPPLAARPSVTGGKAPSEDLDTKDRRLAMELAEKVGANIPVIQFMSELDLESAYEAYSTKMK